MKHVNSDLAYDYIRKRILAGEYPPGFPLMTNALATEIGVSRTPVRDALRQLEADGLVTIKARLGASVKSMDLTEFRETCGLRLALESHAAGLAAIHRTEVDLHEIGLALEAMRKLTERIVHVEDEGSLIGELVREDVRFHIAIITGARNELMKKEILRLHLINRVVSGHVSSLKVAVEESSSAERVKHRQNVLASHEEIYLAIERQDAAAAKEAMERHIQDIVDRKLREMARGGRESNRDSLTDEELAYAGQV